MIVSKRPLIRLSDLEAQFHKLARSNAHSRHLLDVFRDFCELAAITLSNSVDRINYERREARYMKIIAGYKREEAERFGQMLACVVAILEAGMCDCLGRLFMGLGLGDAGKGQFFTPYEVSSMMARMVMPSLDEAMAAHGFITMNEPAAGAGGMIIAAADAMQEAGINYQQSMHAIAVDIDSTACHMAYIQMTLLHIPGVVVHGNALQPETVWDEWLTPAHIMGGWGRKLAQRDAIEKMRQVIAGGLAVEVEEVGEAAITAVAAPAAVHAAPVVTMAAINEKRRAQAEQMALF